MFAPLTLASFAFAPLLLAPFVFFLVAIDRRRRLIDISLYTTLIAQSA
jgi:hypothetical protein